MINYLCPKPLTEGSKIAVIAPASSFNQEYLHKGLKTISECNMTPILGDNVFFLKKKGMYSASLEDRIKEFIWAIEDDNIDAIICATGGFGTAQILPHLPYDLIAEKRKPIMGFSDITALNNAILARSNMISFNGPTVETYDDDSKNRPALQDAIELLCLNEFWGAKPFMRNKNFPQSVSKGIANGPAIGGNITTFCNLIGTPFMPTVDGAILFIEDVREGALKIAMYLEHLRLAGILDKLGGIVIGSFSQRPDDESDPAIEDVIVEYLQNGPPCIYGLNFSHNEVSAVIPIGTECHLDANRLSVMFGNPFGG